MEVSVRTAQNIDIHYHPAGVLYRLGATIIDFAFLGGLLVIFLAVLSASDSWSRNYVAWILAGIAVTLYHLLCEFFFQGRSIGKLALNLRVVRLDGHKLSFWDCLIRWALRIIDISATLGVGAIVSILFTSQMQRIGDLAAGTTVIQEKSKARHRFAEDYNPDDDYRVEFPQAALLSDKDVAIIKEVWREVEKNHASALLPPLANKIKSLTGIHSTLEDTVFIQTILKDYIHLTKN